MSTKRRIKRGWWGRVGGEITTKPLSREHLHKALLAELTR